MRHAGRGLAFVGLWLLFLASLGWAQQQGQEAKPTAEPRDQQADVAALRARATAFWEARVKEETVGEYQFLEPRVRRRMRVEAFLQGRSMVRYREYAIEGVSVDGDGFKGKVTVRFIAEVRAPIPQAVRTAPATQEATLAEEWVKVGEEWYRRFKQEREDEGGSQ